MVELKVGGGRGIQILMEGQDKAGSRPPVTGGMARDPTLPPAPAKAAQPLLVLPPGVADSDSICPNLLFDPSNSQPWLHIRDTRAGFKIPDVQAKNQTH